MHADEHRRRAATNDFREFNVVLSGRLLHNTVVYSTCRKELARYERRRSVQSHPREALGREHTSATLHAAETRSYKWLLPFI